MPDQVRGLLHELSCTGVMPNGIVVGMLLGAEAGGRFKMVGDHLKGCAIICRNDCGIEGAGEVSVS